MSDSPPRRRWSRRLLRLTCAVAGLALAAWAWGAVATAEQERTDTQVQTIRDALMGDGSTRHLRYSGPDRGGFLGNKTNGAWGKTWVSRAPERVLDDLRAGAASATIDEPFCVTPDERAPRDAIAEQAQIDPWVYACDLTRSGRTFGWVEVTLDGQGKDGRTWSVVEYGIGPDAGYRRLHTLVASPAPGRRGRRAVSPSGNQHRAPGRRMPATGGQTGD